MIVIHYYGLTNSCAVCDGRVEVTVLEGEETRDERSWMLLAALRKRARSNGTTQPHGTMDVSPMIPKNTVTRALFKALVLRALELKDE